MPPHAPSSHLAYPSATTTRPADPAALALAYADVLGPTWPSRREASLCCTRRLVAWSSRVRQSPVANGVGALEVGAVSAAAAAGRAGWWRRPVGGRLTDLCALDCHNLASSTDRTLRSPRQHLCALQGWCRAQGKRQWMRRRNISQKFCGR
jgi:hypothetical protein